MEHCTSGGQKTKGKKEEGVSIKTNRERERYRGDIKRSNNDTDSVVGKPEQGKIRIKGEGVNGVREIGV